MRVERGWQGFSEINRVQYESEQVTLEQLETWVKESGTWRQTLEQGPVDDR